jgi:hypothetical protein
MTRTIPSRRYIFKEDVNGYASSLVWNLADYVQIMPGFIETVTLSPPQSKRMSSDVNIQTKCVMKFGV